MLKHFVGTKAMPNIALLSTMWSGINECSKLERREEELCNTFWHDMLKTGAAYHRFEDTTDSAWDIITPLLNAEPVELKFQQELRDGIPVPSTDAGKSVKSKWQNKLINVLADLLRALFRW